MTKTEAQQQIETFFQKLGQKVSFLADKNFIQARLGEAVIGFEYHEEENSLAAQALIYRFRSEPKDKVLDAIFGEESETNTGGGRLVFESETSTFYLQKDFTEKIDNEIFYETIKNLGVASLVWNSEILAKAAEKANSN